MPAKLSQSRCFAGGDLQIETLGNEGLGWRQQVPDNVALGVILAADANRTLGPPEPAPAYDCADTAIHHRHDLGPQPRIDSLVLLSPFALALDDLRRPKA
jgi:hypothetical protein